MTNWLTDWLTESLELDRLTDQISIHGLSELLPDRLNHWLNDILDGW